MHVSEGGVFELFTIEDIVERTIIEVILVS